AEIPDGRPNAGWCDLLNEGAQALEDHIRILVRHETAADLRVGVSRDDRLAALALEAAPHPVDVERRGTTASLARAEAFLAEQDRQAEMVEVGVVIEGQGREMRSIVVGQRDDLIVEAGHGDATGGSLGRRGDP